jgi:hypothetical protein
MVFAVSLPALYVAVRIGWLIAAKLLPVKENEREDLNLLISACLTLLALIIGFSFSMALSRYDERKNYEEEEANAIGTEYARADLLPPAESEKVRHLLAEYLDQRLLFYTVRDPRRLERINNETTQLESEMWSAVQTAVNARSTATLALAVAGMNDVLNRQGYTQAAWWNRIPLGAWSLMMTLALCCSALTGYGAHDKSRLLSTILPFLVSIAFLFIADIDSPSHGFIRVAPENLISLSQSLRPR